MKKGRIKRMAEVRMKNNEGLGGRKGERKIKWIEIWKQKSPANLHQFQSKCEC